MRSLARRVRALSGYRRDPEFLALEREDIALTLLRLARRLEVS